MRADDTFPGSGTWALDDDEPGGARYRRRSVVGEGGMGRVYVADDAVLHRTVALKALRDADPTAAARLVQEARITAVLDHPAIVPVHDAGVDDDGQPFYVMRLVRGQTIAAALDAAPDLAGRLALLRHLHVACEAVASAHHAGVVHRDLKPENVLVGAFGETQVMDWGLARPITPRSGGWDAVLSDAVATRAGEILGTPAYMSPEQAAGDSVGPPTDVWSLGVMLYELVSGHRAYPGDSAHQVLAAVLRGPPPPLDAACPDAPPELGAIARRALQSDPADRYPDAAALADDLGRYLTGRIVEAHVYTPRDHLRRFVRANRLGVGLTAAVVAVSLVGAAFGVAGLARERDRALAAERVAETAHAEAAANLADALVAQATMALRADRRAEAEVLAARALQLTDHPDARGVLAAFATAGRPELVQEVALPAGRGGVLRPDGRPVVITADALVAVDWEGTEEWSVPVRVASAQGTADGLLAFSRHDDTVVRVVDADGRTQDPPGGRTVQFGLPRPGASSVPTLLPRLNRGPADHVQIVDLAADAAVWLRTAAPAMFAATTDPDAAHVVHRDGAIARYPLDGAGPTPLLPALDHAEMVWSGAIAGRRLLLGTMAGTVELVDLDAPARVYTLDLGDTMVFAVALSSDGRWAAAGIGEEAHVWPTARPEERILLPGAARKLRWLDDGTLVTASPGRVRRWRVPADALQRWVRTSVGGVSDVAGTDEGAWACGAGVAAFGPTGRPLDVGLADQECKAVAGGPAGVAFAASHGDSFVRRPTGERVTLGGPATGVVWLASGHLVVLPYGPGPRIYSPDLELRADLAPPSMTFRILHVDATGRLAALWSDADRRMVFLHDDATPVWRDGWSLPFDPACFALAPGGREIWVCEKDRLVLREVADGSVIRTVAMPALSSAQVSPDGRWLVLGRRDGTARVLDTATGVLRARLRGHRDLVVGLDFDPAGRLLTGSWDRTLRTWDLSVLDTPPDALAAEVLAAWPLSPADVLAAF